MTQYRTKETAPDLWSQKPVDGWQWPGSMEGAPDWVLAARDARKLQVSHKMYDGRWLLSVKDPIKGYVYQSAVPGDWITRTHDGLLIVHKKDFFAENYAEIVPHK